MNAPRKNAWNRTSQHHESTSPNVSVGSSARRAAASQSDAPTPRIARPSSKCSVPCSEPRRSQLCGPTRATGVAAAAAAEAAVGGVDVAMADAARSPSVSQPRLSADMMYGACKTIYPDLAIPYQAAT